MTRGALAGLLALALAAPSVAAAQTRARRRVAAGEVTGLEMGIEGSLGAVPGGRLRWFVTVYEVVRRRELRPSADTTLVVSASFSRGAPLAELRTDARGRASLDVELPDDLGAAARLRVEARSPRRVRRVFTVALERRPRHRVELYADRDRAPAGGSVLLFGRVLDEATGRPVADHEVTVVPGEDPEVTDAHGVFLTRAPAPGSYTARTEHGRAGVTIRPLAPPTDPLWVQAEPARPVVRPGARVPVEVLVRDRLGAPVAGARVRWASGPDGARVEDRIETDAEGRARIDWLLARTSAAPLSTLERALRIVAPGHGSVDHRVSVRFARVDVLSAWSVAGGALVPSLPGRVFVRAVRPDGTAIAGAPVRLESPRLGGSLTATTDADGVAQLDGPVAATAAPDRCGGTTALAATLVIGATREDLCLPVEPDASVVVRARAEARSIIAEVARAAVARRAPVEVAALVHRDGRWAPVAVGVLEPTAREITLTLPAGLSAEAWVRARPLLERGGTARGGGDLVWVGASGVAPTVEAGPEAATAELAGGTTVLVATEVGGTSSLRRALAESMGPAGASIDAGRGPRFVAALLAARVPRDDAASVAWREGRLVPQPMPAVPVARGLLRDPWRTQARFVRGRIGRLMRAVEVEVAEAIPDALDDVAAREGGRWRFNRSVLEAAASENFGEENIASLDGEPLDIEALRALDPAFTYDNVARRITRERLFRVNVMLRDLVRERGLDLPWARRGDVTELIVGLLDASEQHGVEFTIWPEREALFDAWGEPLALRRVRGRARFDFLQPIAGWELTSAGPDGRFGTGDDLVDPFARVLPSRGIYAEAVGEDLLLARLAGVALDRATLRSLSEVFEVDPVEILVDEPEGAPRGWRELPAPTAPALSGAPVTPIRDALGGLGPRVTWALPTERRAYEALAVHFRPDAVRTARGEFVAGAPWVARVELPAALHVGERLDVPVDLVRIADAPEPRVDVDVRGEAVRAVLTGRTLRLFASQPGLADVTVRVRIDARTTSTFERRLRVVPDGALRARAAARWTDADAELRVRTPDDATPWRARLRVAGPRDWLFGEALERVHARHPAPLAWARASTDQDLSDWVNAPQATTAIAIACGLVATATQPGRGHVVRAESERLVRALDDELGTRAAVLAILAGSATGDPEGGDDPVGDLVAELRQDGWRALRHATDRPAVMARMAAALLLADRHDAAGRLLLARATARLRRDAHGRSWVPGRRSRPGDAWMGTAALAIAARQVDDDALARELASSVAARLRPLLALGVEGTFWALAAGVYGVFGVESPSRAVVTINGEEQTVTLDEAHAELPLPPRADVRVAVDAPALVDVEARYLVARAARSDGPLRAGTEGSVGRAGQRSGMELVVTNETDQDVAAPTVEITLPGAARCDEECRATMSRAEAVRRVDPPDLAGTLRVHMATLTARSAHRVPLAIDWIASGRARGLAITAYDVDDPGEMFVSPPRELTIEAAP